jgi:hypothetical protein
LCSKSSASANENNLKHEIDPVVDM